MEPELTTEEVKTIWFDPEAMRLRPYKVGRIAGMDGGRMYYRFGHKEPLSVELFNSLTTVIYQCCPMPFSLLEWYCKLGLKEAKRFSNAQAMYGSLMHIEIGKYCEQLVYDFDKVSEVVDEYLSYHSFFEPECVEWKWRLKQDMIAWVSFAHETKMKPLAVEMVLCSSRGFATPIDVVCYLELPVKGDWGEKYASGPRKGEPKITNKPVRKLAVINMKSGRHGFYENNGLQIQAEKELFEENFPDLKVEAALNWAPADWGSIESKEKSKYKDWTGSIDEREIDCMFKLAEVKFRDKMEEKERLSIFGQYMYGNDPVHNMSTIKIVDLIRKIEVAKVNPE